MFAVVQPIWATKRETAARVRQRISAVMGLPLDIEAERRCAEELAKTLSRYGCLLLRARPPLGYMCWFERKERIKAREAEFRAIWAGCDLRNDRIKAVTGVEFRSLDESIRDCVESLLAVAKVKPVLRDGFSLPE